MISFVLFLNGSMDAAWNIAVDVAGGCFVRFCGPAVPDWRFSTFR
jgi:hypothetical protein